MHPLSLGCFNPTSSIQYLPNWTHQIPLNNEETFLTSLSLCLRNPSLKRHSHTWWITLLHLLHPVLTDLNFSFAISFSLFLSLSHPPYNSSSGLITSYTLGANPPSLLAHPFPTFIKLLSSSKPHSGSLSFKISTYEPAFEDPSKTQLQTNLTTCFTTIHCYSGQSDHCPKNTQAWSRLLLDPSQLQNEMILLLLLLFASSSPLVPNTIFFF